MKAIDRKIRESLASRDHKSLVNSLEEKMQHVSMMKYRTLIDRINEQSDPEMGMVSAVQAAAKSYGGMNYTYDQGVLTVDVPNKQAALDFGTYLDENPDVDSYDLVAVNDESNSDVVDLDDMTSDFDTVFEFTVYFITDNVSFDAEVVSEAKTCSTDEEDEDESEMEDEMESDEDEKMEESRAYRFRGVIDPSKWMTEATKVVTFSGGKKQVKMRCPPGQKWSNSEKKCVKMSSSENRKRRMAAVKSAVKRKSKMAQITKKRNMAMKKRVSAGF